MALQSSDAVNFHRSEGRHPGELRNMYPNSLGRLRDSEGKGVFGCIVAIVLFGTAIYLAITLGPIYYANYNFEAAIKTEASRAGARSLGDSAIVRNIMVMAKRNEIRLKKEDISIDRFAGQVHIEVNYSVPVSFVLFDRDMNFQIRASSFVGTL